MQGGGFTKLYKTYSQKLFESNLFDELLVTIMHKQ